jgi:hypothetical protein
MVTDEVPWKTITEGFKKTFKVQWKLSRFPNKKNGEKFADRKFWEFVPYIDARECMDVFDDVVTCGHWFDTYKQLGDDALECAITVHGVTKVDVGSIGSAMDSGDLKSGYSDAFKRCSAKWGVGRFVYFISPVYAAVDDWGKPLSTEQWKFDQAVNKNVTPPKQEQQTTTEVPEPSKPKTPAKTTKPVVKSQKDQDVEDFQNFANEIDPRVILVEQIETVGRSLKPGEVTPSADIWAGFKKLWHGIRASK